jgi:2'-5' RNA ligase
MEHTTIARKKIKYNKIKNNNYKEQNWEVKMFVKRIK